MWSIICCVAKIVMLFVQDLKEVDASIDASFLAELKELGKLKAPPSAAAAKPSCGTHHDQLGNQNGVFSAERRVQPRYQTGKKDTFDALARQREKAELDRYRVGKERAGKCYWGLQ
jgi:hypothetical protein